MFCGSKIAITKRIAQRM